MSSSSSSTSRCAACKYLRRRCPPDCIFAPYFPPNNPQRFAFVHRIYGASNVCKILQRVPVHVRATAADSLYYEAKCRMEDPVYGCVGLISHFQQQIYALQTQLARVQAQIAFHNANANANANANNAANTNNAFVVPQHNLVFQTPPTNRFY